MSEIKVMERGRELVINPLVTCQPFGAMFATLGIRRGLPIVHGSQGCSTFVRYGLNRHFREPAEIPSHHFMRMLQSLVAGATS
ncbi:nitrogenase component 1 [Methanothermobacter thermautotrophicus]|uniref:nitrogenase component 1 n=1 Tax=Methanothermobacter thermautotrophicus TaxID=145262 RepID=UPI0021F76D99|nr:nitrogenase component 1 [Methanothermobacter thermautotrophicus]